MKIALVVALDGDLVRSTEHVGIGYIASFLRKNGYSVSIFEFTATDDQDKYKGLFDGKFEVVGFTTTCITMKYVLKLAKILKEHDESIKTVCGGHMATFGGREILRDYSQIDFIVYGEGEISFYELVKCIEENRKLSSVKGIMYRDKGEVKVNEEREFIEDLNSLPFPSRDQFNQHDNRSQYIRISTSRGCLGNCGFCSSFVGRKQKGPRWRGRSPENIVSEIEQIVKTYNFHTFDFVDSTFEDPGEEGKRRIRTIATEILNRDIEIYYNCCFRAENWNENDLDTLELLVKSGLEKINIGFESGNERGLRILNKRATTKDNWSALKVLKKFPDIYLTFGFIMIHPYSVMEDIFDNAKFLHDTGIGQVIRHYFWQLEVYPGTQMEENLIRDKLLRKDYDVEDDMYKYNFASPEVEKFSLKCREFLKIDSVWDFEIFDIIIHTFITRLRRKYKNDDVIDAIEGFSSFVNNKRKEIADFNYEFYMKLYEAKEPYNIRDEMERLDKYIKENMKIIRTAQYKLGREMLRTGMKLVYR
ncbi:MAG: B12-binding domain-containing radical SAM protein [Clostridia bacterium]